MKFLMAIAISLCSLTAGASEGNAVDSLLSVLPIGTHSGDKCTVTVNMADYPVRSAYVLVKSGEMNIFKIVSEGSEFFFEDTKKEFIQTEFVTLDDTRSSSVERIIRTVMTDDERVYVVVEESITVNRERRSDIVECIVKI